jgi:hypothetical protein
LRRSSVSGEIPIFKPSAWQMSWGDRAALEGVLSQCEPELAIEIGTAEGGSLERIAAHSREVHSFDISPPEPWAHELENVHFHTGDSHELLPGVLATLADGGRNVDFALVDGDHSSEGVKRDVEGLLASPAVRHAVVLIHDSSNPSVRAGLEQIDFERYPKVSYVELDFVSGYLFREPSLRHELWGGFALLLIDEANPAGPTREERYYEMFPLLLEMRERVVTGKSVSGLEEELERHRAWLDSIQSSLSWRITAPLRALKRRFRSGVARSGDGA